jgi:hypothetical protein
MPRARTFLWIASAMLAATALMYAVAWGFVRTQFAGEGLETARLLWFNLAADWLLVAGLWFAAGYGGAALLRPLVMLSALIPLASAIGQFVALGASSLGLYLLVLAAAIAIIGAIRLGDEAVVTPPA